MRTAANDNSFPHPGTASAQSDTFRLDVHVETQGALEGVARPRFAACACRALDLLQVLVPKRLADEEIGDAWEVVNSILAGPVSRWTRVLVWVKVVTTYFWTILHAFRETAKAADSKKTE